MSKFLLVLLGFHHIVGCTTKFKECAGCSSCFCSDDNHFVNCSYSRLSKVPVCIPKSAQDINLDGNFITVPPYFPYLNFVNLKSVSLNVNNVTSITVGSFDPAKVVLLSRNILTDIPSHGNNWWIWNTDIKILDISFNKFVHLPTCLFSYTYQFLRNPVPNLEDLYLGYNNIVELDFTVGDLHLEKLRTIDFAGNPIKRLGASSLMHLGEGAPNLMILNFTRCQIDNIEKDAFSKFKQLTTILLAENNIHWSLFVDLYRELALFAIEVVDVRFNNMTLDLPLNGALRGNSHSLALAKNGTTLLLDGNRFKSIPTGAFRNFTGVSHLSLKYCNIREIGADAFDNLDTLDVLHFSYNNISILTESMFTGLQLSKLHLSFHHNPLHCECKHALFLYNLSQSVLSVDHFNFTGYYICHYPEYMKGLDVTSAIDICLGHTSPAVIAIVAIISVTVIIVIVFIVRIFVVKSRRGRLISGKNETSSKTYGTLDANANRSQLGCHAKQYSSIGNEKTEHFLFDAYVCYHADSKDWVLRTLLPFVESKCMKRACISDRDFPIGGSLPDCILEGLQKSRHVIYVLSNGFLWDEWCMFSIENSVQRNHGNYRKQIPIVLEELDPRIIPLTVNSILRTRMPIHWTENETGEFWRKISNSLR